MYNFSFDAELCKAQVGEDGKFYLEGVASTTDVDAQQERMSLSALSDMEKAVPLPLTDSHKAELENEIGTVIEARHQDGKLFIKAQLFEDDAKAVSHFKKLQKGAKAGFSVGGRITSYTPGLAKNEKRIITGVALDHIMLTKRPANANTFAMAFAKALDEIDTELNTTLGKVQEPGVDDSVRSDKLMDNELEKAGAKFSSDTKSDLKGIHDSANDPAAVQAKVRLMLGDDADDILGATAEEEVAEENIVTEPDAIGVGKTNDDKPTLTKSDVEAIKALIVDTVREVTKEALAKSEPLAKNQPLNQSQIADIVLSDKIGKAIRL